MPTLSTDGQSFILDGRRVWLVSGTLAYGRVPRAQWAARLALLRRSGLNTVETPVVWSQHEPQPGKFDFTGDLDLSAFLDEAAQAGLWCIVRLGPFVGERYDAGGLPGWVVAAAGEKCRSAAPEFMARAARFISHAAEIVAPHQVTHSDRRGRVIAVQCEHQWYCGDAATADAYLGEVERHTREAGVNVPILNAGNLYQSRASQVDAWTGTEHLHAVGRQLRTVSPNHPPIVSGLFTECAPNGGNGARDAAEESDPAATARAAAQALSAGMQFNLLPFDRGSYFGFSAGGPIAGPGSAAESAQPLTGAPVHPGASASPALAPLKRLCTFASSFGKVLAHLDAAASPVCINPDAVRAPGDNASLSVIHRNGAQGSLVMLLAKPAAKAPPRETALLLPDGITIPVQLPASGLAWLVLDAHLNGSARLDYTNVFPFALAGKVLALFGEAGAAAVLSISGSIAEATVPEDDEPRIIAHEGMTIVLLNERSVDEAWADDHGLWFGAGGFGADGAPLASGAGARTFRIAATGDIEKPAGARTTGAKSRAKASAPKASPKPEPTRPDRPPALRAWSRAGCPDMVTGSARAFAKTAGPMSMGALNAEGYAWSRLRLKTGAARKVPVMFFPFGGRAALFVDGRDSGLIGVGPGANGGPVTLALPKGAATLTALCDNPGRSAGGNGVGIDAGFGAHAWEVSALRPGAPTMQSDSPISPLSVRTPVMGLDGTELTDPQRVTWKITHRARTALLIDVSPLPAPAVVLWNGVALGVCPTDAPLRAVMEGDAVHRGNNTLQFAVVGDAKSLAPKVAACVRVFEGHARLTEEAEWAFARWQPPASAAFEAWTAPARGGGQDTVGPAWWRAAVGASAADRSWFIETKGLSKGAIVVNGRVLGRYFVATADGKDAGGARRLELPGSWLRADGESELLVFDEHGFAPTGVRIVADLPAGGR